MKTTAFTKSYGKRVVLSLPELELSRGEITAIIGPNGSGKSTLAKVLAGIERADNNRSILPGVSVGLIPAGFECVIETAGDCRGNRS